MTTKLWIKYKFIWSLYKIYESQITGSKSIFQLWGAESVFRNLTVFKKIVKNIYNLLWNWKVYSYELIVELLCQSNLVYTATTCFIKTMLILSSRLFLSLPCYLFFWILQLIFYVCIHTPCCFDIANFMWLREQTLNSTLLFFSILLFYIFCGDKRTGISHTCLANKVRTFASDSQSSAKIIKRNAAENVIVSYYKTCF